MSDRSRPRRRVLRLLRSHGWNAISFQVLKPGFRYWFSEQPEGAVAYVVSGRYWLAAGAPVCAPGDLAAVADGFAREAARHGRRAAFFGAVDRLVQALPEFDWLQVGSQAWWDPRGWTRAVAGTSVPSQVRRARRKGLEVREIGVDELAPGSPLRGQARELQRRWRERHRLPPMRYLVDLTPFTCRQERRYFGGLLEGRLVALGVAVPIYARNGWFLESLLFDPPVPNGTAEAVVDLAMRTLGAEGASFATTGLSALVGLGGRPRRHAGLALLMKACYASLSSLYNFQGIERFQVRLRPDGWEPVYVMAWRRVTPGTVWAVLAAFAGGRVDRFAWRAGRRRLEAMPAPAWARMAEVLGALLVPWSALLLAVDPPTSWTAAATPSPVTPWTSRRSRNRRRLHPSGRGDSVGRVGYSSGWSFFRCLWNSEKVGRLGSLGGGFGWQVSRTRAWMAFHPSVTPNASKSRISIAKGKTHELGH